MKKLTDGLKTLTGILLLFASVVVLGTVSPTVASLTNDTLHLYTPKNFYTIEYAEVFKGTESETAWNALLKEALNSDKKIIVFHVTGNGGELELLDKVKQVIVQLKSQGKRIIMKAEGEVASAHAGLLCEGDQLILSHRSYVLFHAASYQKSATSTLQTLSARKIQVEFLKTCLDKKIISQTDFYYMLQGFNVIKLTKDNSTKTINQKRDDIDFTN